MLFRSDAASNPLHSIGIHLATLHGILFVQSGCILPGCMDYTAFNPNAWNPLHLMTLHGIHCIQSGCFWPWCIKSTAFNHAAWYPLHSIGMFSDMLPKIHSIKSGCFGPCCKKFTAFIHAAGIHCILSCCIKSPAFNRDEFYQAAWNPLHSIKLHGIHCIQSGCILPGCMEYTAFNNAE